MSAVTIHRLDERPDLMDRVYEVDFTWPDFMGKDPVANALYWQVTGAFPHLCAAATDASGAVVASARALAFTLGLPDRGDLPDGGLDRVTIWAFNDRLTGRVPDIASAVEIVVARAYQGSGLSRRMLAALCNAARDAGLPRLVAPVRPNGKHRYPHMPMSKYITMMREDGLPADPWLRVHVRAGRADSACSPHIDGNGRLGGAVAGMDWLAVRPVRRCDRTGGAGAGALRHGTRPCRLCGAKRLG